MPPAEWSRPRTRCHSPDPTPSSDCARSGEELLLRLISSYLNVACSVRCIFLLPRYFLMSLMKPHANHVVDYFPFGLRNNPIIFSRNRSFTTPVESATPHPTWGQKHSFNGLDREELFRAQIEVTVWNFSHTSKHECIGEPI